MASRRGRTRSSGKWTGLRSQKQEVAYGEVAGDGAWAPEEDDEGVAADPARLERSC